jgi:hypothetical protein
MPLLEYECQLCGARRQTLRKAPKCNHNQEEEGEPYPVSEMVKVLSAPQAKFMEPKNKEKGSSTLKDQQKILMERAKHHARDNDYHDLTQGNNLEMAKRHGWVREDGSIRKKVDDL